MKFSTRAGLVASIAATLAGSAGMAAAAQAAPAQATAAVPATSAEHTSSTLYQRFDVDRSGEWTTVTLRLDPQAWRAGSPDGPAATPKQWLAALKAMRAMVIGADCSPVVYGSTTYPCSFSLAKVVLDDDVSSDVSTQGWRSTSTSALHSTGLQMVSAIATPQTAAMPLSSIVGRRFVGLIAPTTMRDKVAAASSRVLRVHVRAGSTPAAEADARVGGGLLVLTSDAFEPPAPVVPKAADTDVALRLIHRDARRR